MNIHDAIRDANRPPTVAELLDAVVHHIRTYVVVGEAETVAVSLWVLHTHALHAAEATPYLGVTSPEMRSGKSRLFEVLEGLVCEPWRVVLPSEAVTFRRIARDTPTLLLDETDAIWSGPNQKDHEGLRGILNAGYRRGSMVSRCSGPSLELKDFETFCCKAVGGIGQLPTTIADRCIAIRMQRKKRSDHISRFRLRDVKPIAEELRKQISSVMHDAVTELRLARPDLPEELDDRAQEGWEPLLAIADMAGEEWAARARAAALEIAGEREEDEGTIAHRLLGECKQVFDETGVERLQSGDLVKHLVDIPDAPWADYMGKPVTGRRVAGWLRAYGIKPRKIRDFRGYLRADFNDAWLRYVPESVPSVPVESGSGIAEFSQVSPNPSGDTLKNSDNSLNHAVGDTWNTLEPEKRASDTPESVEKGIAAVEAALEDQGYRSMGQAEWREIVESVLQDTAAGPEAVESSVHMLRGLYRHVISENGVAS